jgi:hypothetical protein
MARCNGKAGSTHDKILRCRINAAFQMRAERCIYAAERRIRRNVSCVQRGAFGSVAKNLLASFRNLNQHAAWQWVPVRFK